MAIFAHATLRQGEMTDSFESRIVCVAHGLLCCARLVDQLLADLEVAKEGVSRNQWLTRQQSRAKECEPNGLRDIVAELWSVSTVFGSRH